MCGRGNVRTVGEYGGVKSACTFEWGVVVGRITHRRRWRM